MNKIAGLHREYHAGNQMWFMAKKRFGQDCRIHHYGCGVVAMLDFCIYKGLIENPKSRQEYMDGIRRMERRWLHIIPGFGISPYCYAFLVNLYYRFHKIPYRLGRMRVSGGKKVRAERLTLGIQKQLKYDLPLIFAAGPVIPIFGKREKITLYRFVNGDMIESGQKVRSHYMTITGLCRYDETCYIQLATWGEIRYMKLEDYVRYGKYTIPLTNIIYETRIIQK